MYEAFYGLKSKPFQLNPDPNFYFASKQHRRAKAYLEYGVSRNEGFIVITGEIGAGKTMVLRSLIEGLNGSNVITGHLVTTQLGAEDTLRMVGAAFGFRVKDVPKSELLITLEAFLISQTSKGKRCLLIVDEAQNLTPRAVEELRMLQQLPVRQPGAAAELPGRPARVPRDPAAPRDGAVPPARVGHLPHRPAGRRRDPGLHRAPPQVRRRQRQAELRARPSSPRSTRPAAASRGASTRSATACCWPASWATTRTSRWPTWPRWCRSSSRRAACRCAAAEPALSAGADPTMPGGLAGAVLDVDLSHVKLDADEAEGMSRQIAALTADQRGDQLQRLERSLLRLERINVQTLAMLQKLVNAVKKPDDKPS